MPALKVYDGTSWQYLSGFGSTSLLATKIYNPGVAALYTSSSGTFADMDATNLVVTFTAPASGTVLVSLTAWAQVANSGAVLSWNLRSGSSDVTGTASAVSYAAGSGDIEERNNHRFVITGLTPGTSYTYKWGFARTLGTGNVYTKAGGAEGQAVMEVWDAQPGGGAPIGSSVVIDVAHKRRTAGDLTLNSTTWADVDNNLDLVLTAAVGDEVEVSVSGFWGNTGVYAFLDCVSLVGGSPVNSWASNGTPNASGQGVRGWWGKISSDEPITGSISRTLVSGDISSGTVTLRLRYRTFTATNRTFLASTADQFWWGAQVLRPPA